MFLPPVLLTEQGSGGVTGIAMIINYLTDIPVGVMNLIINIPLFIWAWKGFGLKFIVGSFVATVLSSVFVDLYAYFGIVATENMLLAAIYGGVLNGLGLGLVYRAGDTTGGIDIVAKFVRRKYPYMNFGTIILILDIIIYAAFAIIFNEFEAAMYAVIAMFVVTRVIDLVLYGLGTSKVCYIISDESEKLKNAITATLGRGVTLLKGEGAYTGRAKNVILCVIKKQQIMDVRRIIKSIDTHAFLIVTEAKDVYGNGFGDITNES